MDHLVTTIITAFLIWLSPLIFANEALLGIRQTSPRREETANGYWGDWTPWAKCSATCGGGGHKHRARFCFPAGKYGKEVCDRPSTIYVDKQPCGLEVCEGDSWMNISVIPLGCWLMDGNPDPAILEGQNPGACVQYCNSTGLGYKYAGITQHEYVPQGGMNCYCTNNYTALGRSNKCDYACHKDSITPYYGYLCGYNQGQSIASVYTTRGVATGTVDEWSDWSPCNCSTGTRKRTRECYVSINDTACEETLMEEEKCRTSSNVGDWSEWTSWSECSLTCGGGGRMIRTRVCQPPCNGEVKQLCEIAGEVETDEMQCGFASCLKGSWNVAVDSYPECGKSDGSGFLKDITLPGVDMNPGLCSDICSYYGAKGILLDMGQVEKNHCSCMAGDTFHQYLERIDPSLCNQTCGNGEFPSYPCGTETTFVGSYYYVRGSESAETGVPRSWSDWSSCHCPRGRSRRQSCILTVSYKDCSPPVQPTIEYQACPPDECVVCQNITLQNGIVGGDHISGFGAVKRFQCDRDYRLIGPIMVQCTTDGEWRPNMPFCQPTFCKKLIIYKHQWISEESGSGGRVVTFTCSDGYTLIGNETLECDDQGHWNGTQPLCEAKPDVQNPNTTNTLDGPLGREENITFTFSATQPIKVWWLMPSILKPLEESEGPYELEGPIVVNSTETDTPVMQCVLIINNVTEDTLGTLTFVAENGAGVAIGQVELAAFNCPPLQPPDHEEIVMETNNRTVLFSCKPGLTLVGNPSLYCGIDGKWNGTEPSCQAAPVLISPNGNETEDIPMETGDNITLNCTFSMTQPSQVGWLIPPGANETSLLIVTFDDSNDETDLNISQVSTTLHINNANPEVTGVFVCQGSNVLGNKSARFQLHLPATLCNKASIVDLLFKTWKCGAIAIPGGFALGVIVCLLVTQLCQIKHRSSSSDSQTFFEQREFNNEEQPLLRESDVLRSQDEEEHNADGDNDDNNDDDDNDDDYDDVIPMNPGQEQSIQVVVK